MIRDRGSIKWTSMMIPEHVQALRDWIYHEKNDEEKPDIAEDQFDEIDRIIRDALENVHKIDICFYDYGLRRKRNIIGTINKIDHLRRFIDIVSEDGKPKRVCADDILELKTAE